MDSGQLGLFDEPVSGGEAGSPPVWVFPDGADVVTAREMLQSQTLESASFTMGRNHELVLAAQGIRKESGSYYTPREVVEGLLVRALRPVLLEREKRGLEAVKAVRVLDPACGSGNFLVAAARLIAESLSRLGMDTAAAWEHALGRSVIGADIDRRACELSATSLMAAAPVSDLDIAPQVVCLDALLVPRRGAQGVSWMSILAATGSVAEGFTLVIGNPPFLSQLSTETASSGEYRRQLKARFGESVGSYTDPAALFLALSIEIADPDQGKATLIQPVSVLASRDAAKVRRWLMRESSLEEIWIARERVFDAGVDVCAPTFVRGVRSASTTMTIDRDVHEFALADAPEDEHSWATFLALARDVPSVSIDHSATLGQLCQATADFRDQFYGVAPHVVDSVDGGADQPRLVTVGLIDPAHLRWSERKTKIGGQTFEHPRVPLEALDSKLRSWATSRLRPKILVATQSRVVEVVVDEVGELLPSVPVISVFAEPDQLWRVAACLTSPPVAAWALHRYLGTALSIDALKLSARQIELVPIPLDSEAWAEGARFFKQASEAATQLERNAFLRSLGEIMCQAYRVENPGHVFNWWARRMGVGDAA